MPSFLDLISILSMSTYYPIDSFFSHDAHPYTSNLLPQHLIYWKSAAFASHVQNNIGEVKKKEEQSSLLHTQDKSIQLPRVPQEEHISSMPSSNIGDTNVHTDSLRAKAYPIVRCRCSYVGKTHLLCKRKI